MAKILVTDTVQLGEATYPDIQVDYKPNIERNDLLKIVADYDAIITRSRTKVDAELIEAATNLSVVGRGGVGVDNIDLDAASRRGVLVLNAPEANNVSAAELAIALMLSAARGVNRSDKLTREGIWDRKYLGRELNNGRLAIVGLGRIGTLVARRAQGLGMSVMAYDPYVSPKHAEQNDVELFSNLKEMLVKADFLTVHTPLTDETKGIIGRPELACLPNHAVVVNAARGGIIEENALAEVLQEKQIFAAGIDVFVLEPPSVDHPLLQLDNLVITAHLGANTQEAQERVGSEILERTAKALMGDVSKGAVNAPSLSKEVMERLGPYLELAESMGKMVSQLSSGRIQELKVEVNGDFSDDPEPIVVAAIKGALEPILTDPPNYINAGAIAKERGINVSRINGSDDKGYTQYVEVTAVTDGDSACVGGTVLGGTPRVVSINNFTIEVKPEGTMLICTNHDKPGAVGKVGTVLGNANINISFMQLSRVGADGKALFVLALDHAPDAAIIEELKKLPDTLSSLDVVKV